MGLRNEYDYRTAEALDACIDYTIKATVIVKKELETFNNWGPKDVVNAFDEAMIMRKAEEYKQHKEYTTESPVQLFDAMKFHPKVIEASRSCFITGNYRGATIDTFISLVDYVKEKTELDLDGDNLMSQVFSFTYDKESKRITRYPIIRINELKNQSNRDEQQGFMYLCKGAAVGIRNPKVHKLIPQSNPLHTLEYLALASLLFRRIDEGKVVKPIPQRKKWDWDRFLADAQNRCELEVVDLAIKLYEFTEGNADSVSWGTGAQDGSFTFRKLGFGEMNSIFTMYSYGRIYINFGSMKDKYVPSSIIESFRIELNKIPSVNLPKEAVTIGRYPHMNEKPLINPENLKLFEDAILSLCQQFENS